LRLFYHNKRITFSNSQRFVDIIWRQDESKYYFFITALTTNHACISSVQGSP